MWFVSRTRGNSAGLSLSPEPQPPVSVCSQGGEFPICPWFKCLPTGAWAEAGVAKISASLGVLSARMVRPSPRALLRCSFSLLPGVTMVTRGSSAPRGWKKLNGAVPEPVVAAGLWLWECLRQAQPGSHAVPIPFKCWAKASQQLHISAQARQGG